MLPWTRRDFLRTAPAASLVPAFASPAFAQSGVEYVSIPAGSFLMGETHPIPPAMCEPLAYMTRAELQAMFPHGDPARFVLSDTLFRHGDKDAAPQRVTIAHSFSLAATPVTNAQYERFDPAHRKLRGRFGFSTGDDDAVIYVSWHDAVAYCAWLTRKEGRHYRLPTEAEWEYACRAGGTTLFSSGELPPQGSIQNARVTDFTAPEDKISLRVGQTAANAWGLHNMHGLVEEWVHDWYAPQASPSGGAEQGTFRVTRGGSHGTFAYYLRSANRSAALPETRGFTIGFRVVCAEPLPAKRAVVSAAAPAHKAVASAPIAHGGPVPSVPYFRGPVRFVRLPANADGPVYAWHNHDTALTECPNGDLLAAWYICAREQGRELSVAAARLPLGTTEWSEAYSFYDTPDRNDHCPALWCDSEGTLYHLNGTALSHFWEPLQIVLRTSVDNGHTWSTPRYIAPDFGLRNMVCQPILRLSNGWWIFGADAHPASSALWLSKDKGITWECTPGNIHGIHAAIAETHDGRLVALGRGNNVDGHLPMSISEDFGTKWKAEATDLPPVTYTQRFAMTRLAEGPLALVTFLPDVTALQAQQPTDRELAKLCICLSYDDGKTWPMRRVLSNEARDRGITGMSNGRVYLGPGYGEPTGYCSILQARNGVIHVLSSMNHYSFNLAWVRATPASTDPMPRPQSLQSRPALRKTLSAAQVQQLQTNDRHWTTERTGLLDALDTATGFTVEAELKRPLQGDAAFILRAFARSGCTMCNRYWLRVTKSGVAYWYAGKWQPLKNSWSAPLPRTFRISVRPDTCVQIYVDGHLLAAYPPSYEIGFAPPTRGNWMEGEWPTGTPQQDITLRYDTSGAYAPNGLTTG